MTFWFRGHHYRSQFTYTLVSLTHWWNVKGFIKAFWRGEKYLIWVGHMDDCCDYWTSINDPKAQRAFMLDDELGLETDISVTTAASDGSDPTTKPVKNANKQGSGEV